MNKSTIILGSLLLIVCNVFAWYVFVDISETKQIVSKKERIYAKKDKNGYIDPFAFHRSTRMTDDERAKEKAEEDAKDIAEIQARIDAQNKKDLP